MAYISVFGSKEIYLMTTNRIKPKSETTLNLSFSTIFPLIYGSLLRPLSASISNKANLGGNVLFAKHGLFLFLFHPLFATRLITPVRQLMGKR